MSLDNSSQLAAAQAELLARRLRGEPSARRSVEAALVREPRGTFPPLSFAQQRLWFLGQLHHDSVAYTTAETVYRVRGALDVPALREAIRAVVERHPPLRSRFAALDGQPYVVVDEPDAIALHTVDVSGHDDPLAAAREHVTAQTQTPFDLATGPLMRATLLRLAADDHILVMTIHHIVFDGWSTGILERDLSAAYHAATTGQPASWRALPVDYTDFARWQRQHLTPERLAKQLDHWRAALGDAPALLQLPTDKPRPARPSHRGAVVRFTVPEATATRLRALSRAHRTTLFTTTLAAYQVLLSRYAHTTDVITGCPSAGRGRTEVEDLVGFFVNTLPVRADLGDNPGFSTLLRRTRTATLDAFANQDLPFQHLVEELAPTRDLSHNPLVQAWFDLSVPTDRFTLGVATAERIRLRELPTNFDLVLHLMDRGDAGLTGELLYATDLFDEPTVTRFAEHYTRLLAAVADDPDQPVAALDITDPVETRRLLQVDTGNGQPPRHTTVVAGFEEQVQRTPDATALIDGHRSVSYAELNSHANRLARRLLTRGVRPDQAVGLLLPRGADFVIALIAVLKAGAGYLPLDPEHPADRIAYMLGDARARFLVTDGLRDHLVPAGLRTVVPDQADPEPADPVTSADPVTAVGPEHLCYVIYTSGSTGRPKGVAMAHLPLAQLIEWQIDRTTVTGPTLQFASLNFDAAFQELFTTLLSGGSLVLISEQDRRDPARVLAVIRENGVERLFCPPMVLEQLATQAAAEGAVPPSLREIITAGERLSLSTEVRAFLSQLPGVVLENQCGPTETHALTAHLMAGAPTQWPTRPPIGRPILPARVHLLDEQLGLVPVGVPGELYASGRLAWGYVGRPDLTAERFLPDPFTDEPGGRMYRTGDLARWRTDGTLEFLGRTDDQVKIRGYRVEPAETEARLRELPRISEAAVLPVEVVPGDRRLVAYFTTTDGTPRAAAELRALLTESLPDYMVPAHYVQLAKLPLTTTGKLDRSALQRTALPEHKLEPDSRAPRNPQEELLAGLFADLLGLQHVGVDTGFFDLGGHSLLAAKLISRVRSALGVELGIRDLFEHPTVAGLATRVNLAGESRPALVRTTERPAVLPLSAAQRRVWFLNRISQQADYNVPLAVRLRGALDLDALRAALTDVVTRHEALRTVFPETDGEPCQHVLPPESATVTLDVLPCNPEDLADNLAELAVREFDLATELPLRAALYQLAENEQVLAVVVHHIATDGWSTDVLRSDLATAYTARSNGQDPQLAPPAVQYADFTLWQHHLLGDDQDPDSLISRQLAFWHEQLADLPAELELPYDRPRPPVASNEGGFVPVTIDEKLHTRLVELAREHDCTLFMVLHAALAVLLSRLGAGQDIPIGAPVAGRSDEALDDLIGFFINAVVLRTDLSGDPTFTELLDRVKNSDLAAYEHQDTPFERVVEALNPDRSLARHPLFQVLLQLDETPPSRPTLANLTDDDEPVRFAVSKFDLRLGLVDQRDTTGTPTGITGTLEYATDLFDHTTVETLATRLHLLLPQLATHPHRRISEPDLLSPQERHQILVDWNNTDTPTSEQTVPQLFETHAAHTPDNPAVVTAHDTLTYRELNSRANQLAHRLTELGAAPEHLIAVALPQTTDLLIALLAILKTGAGYLPLNPTQPADRLAAVLRAATPTLTLTSTNLAHQVPGPNTLLLDDPHHTATIENQPDTNLRHRPAPANPAYVIYTSGSTGEPKGVVIEHRSLSLYLAWARHAYPAMHGQALVHSPIAFDLTVTGIWGPLTSGGQVHLVTLDDQGPTPHQPTFVKATPSHLALFDLLPDEYAPTQQLVLGGELLLGAALDEWRTRHPHVTVMNEYGPTETTVGCAEFRIAPGDPVPTGAITIGRPIWNTRWYILDTSLNPVPPGVTGELFISGGLLARGYLNQPDLTAERFLPDPFTDEPGARMYRTGDLVSWRPDGQVDFIGRADDQVKVRGFRIELGEVEAVIAAQPGITAAAATVIDNTLVGYAVPATGQPLDTHALRTQLARTLPEYMLPTTFVTLDRLPLTKNGKLDRRALPHPAPTTTGTPHHAPRTPTEQTLSHLFTQTLNLTHINTDDNFFDLGGHSLLAAKLISRVRSALGVELGIRDLFEHPTVAGLATRVNLAGESRPALVRTTERPAVLPLSAAQRRVWFLNRIGQGADYNVPLAVRLRGALDLDALRAALTDVVTRHEALRTVFPETDGEPCQHVLPPESATVTLDVLPCNPEDLADNLAELAVREFDLATELPLRAALYQLAENEQVLAVVVHHIATDGWSTDVLRSDLATAYTARSNGQDPQLAPPAVQYADFTLWQHHLLGDDQDPDSLISRQLAFWHEQLADLPPELELPYDRPRPPVASNEGGFVPVTIDEKLHTRLVELAREHDCTLFMVLHAALAVLLSRLGAGQDIPIGAPVAGRSDEALDDLIGFFINTLVLRTDLSDDPTFTELLDRVKDSDLAAYEHQDTPFERVVEALNPDRSLARHPLFQVMLQLDEVGTSGLELPGLCTTQEPVRFAVSKFDLRLDLVDQRDTTGTPTGITGTLEYATDLFDHTTVETLATRLHLLLPQLATHPQRRISEPDLLSPQERHQILVDWNNTDTPTTEHTVPQLTEQTVPQLFETHAAHTPDNPAVVTAHDTLTYRELNSRANQLAHRLTELGAAPEHLIAVALPQTTDLLIALLAILKTGAGYLPLNPTQPADRLAAVLRAATPTLTLTSTNLAHQVPGPNTLLLDDPHHTATIENQPDTNLRHRPAPANPAYVIYTSGSTGEPKGVVIEHRSLSLYLAWARHAYPAMHGQALVHSPIAFDLTVTGIWGPLTSGGQVHLVTLDDQGPTPHQPTFVKATPSHLALFDLLPDEYAPTQQLVLGGEPLLGAALDEWRTRHPHVTVINEYGPTETTVGCAEFRIAPGDPVPTGAITIGRPIWNTRWYILDTSLNPVPPGVTGELFISGGLLARGYLNQPDLTAERFLPDPFTDEPGARMYRTGDLVSWRPDGQVDFIGRADDQVKVRGFRIELGEVEAVIAAQPGITAAAATVIDNTLVGYAVPATGQPLDTHALRTQLARTLPEYMLPTTFVTLDRLPLTKNGKLDRRALPHPAPTTTGTPHHAPRTPTEQTLSHLFTQTLNLTHINTDDNFFDLGGHSLLAARLIAKARSKGLRLGIQDLFNAPTVAGLARRLGSDNDHDSLAVLLPLRAGSSRTPLFCVHPGAGIGWTYSALLSRLDQDQPVYALQAHAVRNPGELPQSVEEMAADYVEQIRSVQPTGPYQLLGWSFGAVIAHAMAVHLQNEGEQVALLALLDNDPTEVDAEQELSEAAVLNELLASLGHPEVVPDGTSLDLQDFVRLASTGDGPLAGLDRQTISALGQAFVGHRDLARRHRPAVYQGDAVLFRATLTRADDLTDAWQPFVAGTLTEHEIACAHGDMMHSRPAAEIASVLISRLVDQPKA
ncbi:non-ribosomal peptide synthetase [Kitasatospora brasiliensis]|uniref:non-ribosomal peptide synthetase n=1 Tax=Kitasatospora brasiliensis TaxID=3058040 RepID=UPI00293187BF|nr:non-ribosomal peptide synthetase [Kitasatospora sp. K002]